MDAKLMVILALVASAAAGPLTKQDTFKCPETCKESSKYKYNTGTTYVYEYRVETESSIVGAFEDSARLTLKTNAHIEILSPCEFVLKLTDTKLFHTDASGVLKSANRENEFRSEIEGSPLRFSFQDGVVDYVCALQEDSVRSFNLKKGILSAFQNSMDDLTQSQNVTETDVTGTCKAEYKLISNGYYTTEVRKVKDILSCTDRFDFISMAQATPYNVNSDLHTLPIMKTTHECDQTIEIGGVLKSSTCKESHVYRPFANGQSGGSTMVTQTLTYKTYRYGVYQSSDAAFGRSFLLFDHSADHPSKEQSRTSVEEIIDKICDTTRFDVRPESPKLFTELISAMKGLEKQDLTDLHSLLKTKSMCPTNGKAYKFFHDALPMLGNTASVSLMTQLINDKDVTGLEADAWLTSFAFIQYPTSTMLFDVKTLIDNKEFRIKALLPVSSMINNCKMNDKCDHGYVMRLMLSIISSIDSSCDASGEKFELTLLALKAIGNAGPIGTVPVVNKCLTSSSNSLEIRIAAAEAFRRMSCFSHDKDLWNTFTDKDLDSELRISAYLALMHCPTKETLQQIVTTLNSEEDVQVGAFVFSHLTNLKETSDPLKQDAADAINNLALDKEFELNPLKFSRNFEVSGLLSKINSGVTAESNLIWSNNVHLPRALSANLTVQLFGQSINLLDFGGRFEGLEYLIKNIFGPYVKNNEKELMLDADNLKGSFYGRLFGNEIMFMHSKTAKSMFGSETPNFLEIMMNLANEQYAAFTQSVQFMDLCMVIPTSAGLPIHMQVNGTATIDVSMSGKMDLLKAGAAPRSLNVDGEIKPSAALELTGSMYVDSFVTKTGIRMRNTMHTSTAMKGRVELKRGQKLNVEIDTPEEKTEVFGASSKFVLLHDGIEQEQDMIKENRKEMKYCSSKQLTTITGMEMCGELSFPNASMKTDSPYFPFTGPSSVSVNLFKRDTHSGYKLFAMRVQNKKASTLQLNFKTPGSKINRAISVDMSLNYKKQEAEMRLATPWKKVALTGNMINQKDMKSVSGSLVVDDKETYAMAGEVKVFQSKSKIQLNPMIEFRRPGADNIQLAGFLSIEKPWKAINMDMSLSGINKRPYSVKSGLRNTNREKSIQAGISFDGRNEYSLSASSVNSWYKNSEMKMMKNKLEIASPERSIVTLLNSVDYRQGKSLRTNSRLFIYRVMKKTATLKVNLEKMSRKKFDNYNAVLNLKAQQISADVTCNIKKTSKSVSMANKIDYNIPQVSKNIINLNGKLKDRSTNALKAYIVMSNLLVKRNPEYNSNIQIEIGHKKKNNLSTASVNVKYGDNHNDKTKRVYLYTSVTRNFASMENIMLNYKLKAQAPAHNIDVIVNGKHEHNGKRLNTNLKFAYAPEKEIEAGISLKDQTTKLMRMNGNAFVSWPGKSYKVVTDLSQKSAKQYEHSLDFQNSEGTKHSIVTIYRTPKSDSHNFALDLNIHKMKTISLSGSTNLKWKHFSASGGLKRGDDVYGFKTLSKYSIKASNAKMNFELIHPARRITFDVKGEKNNNKYDGHIEAAWDANNDKSKKMTLKGVYFHKMSKGATSLGYNLNFRSPFDNFENLVGLFRFGDDRKQYSVNGKLSWAKSQTIASTMTVKKPISLGKLQLNGNIKTPFKGFRNAELDIDHKLDSGLSTVLRGDFGKETAKLTLQGEQLKNGYKGNMLLKSTLKNAESVSLFASHIGNGGSCTNNAKLKHNGNVYGYDLTMSHSANGWQRKTSGDLMLTLNKQMITTHWDHKNTDSIVNSVLTSKWNDKRIVFDLTGSHKLSSHRYISGVMKIKSPWKPLKNIEFNLDHKHGTGLVDSIAFFKQGSKTQASSNIQFTKGQSLFDIDFNIVSPFHENLTGKLNTNYNRYPMTTSVELNWAPKMKGTLESSLNLASWNNADLNLKMTTPSPTVSNILLKASNKKQSGEYISRLNLDYGIKKNIDIESRISNENQNKMFRFKLSSPFKQIQILNTGLNFNGQVDNFDTTVDFEIVPTIGRFNGAVNWKNDIDLNGKFRLDTPFVEFPYFELSTSSKTNGGATKAHIQVEYSPKDVFSFDTNYKFDLPLNFDVTIRSPYTQFNGIGMSLKHNMLNSSIQSQGEVQYTSDKKIKADFNADWASDLETNFFVKTPFNDYESNKISLRYRGKMNNFESRGEIDVAHQNILADASFKSGYHTTGTFTFSSPIAGFEKIDLILKKKGDMKNLKGVASITVNNKKYQTILNNKLTKDTLKTNFNLLTPHTESFKVYLDHSGLLESFNNKLGLNYGREIDIDTQVLFNLRGNDIDGKGIVKYKLNKGRNTARIGFSKSGSINDISLTTTGSFNKDDITVIAYLKTIDGIDGSVQIKTPFKNFKNTGMTFTYSGDMNDFNSETNINYNDKKNINGKFKFSNVAGIKLNGGLTTPFKGFESTYVEFNHDINAYSDVTGYGKLSSTIGKFGTGDISYSESGALLDLTIGASATYNGKNMAELKITHAIHNVDMHSMFSLSSVATPKVHLSIDHSGDRFSFYTKAVGKIGKNIVTSTTNMKRMYDSVNAETSITYKLRGQDKNEVTITIKKDGPLDNFNVKMIGKFNNDELKLAASRSGQLNDIHMSGSASYNKDSVDITGSWKNTDSIEGGLKLLTPFEKFSNFDIIFSHVGVLSDFTSKLNVNYLDNNIINGKVELRAHLLNDIKFTSELTTPFQDIEHVTMKFKNIYNKYTLELNGEAVINTDIANFGTGSISYSKSGGMNDFVLSGAANYNGKSLSELKLSHDMKDGEMDSKFTLTSVAASKVYMSIKHSGDLSNFNTKAVGKYGKNRVTFTTGMKTAYDSIDAGSSLTYTLMGKNENKVTITIKKDGPLDKCKIGIVGKFNDDGVKLAASRSGPLNNIHLTGFASYNKDSVDITGSWKDTDKIEGNIKLLTPFEKFSNFDLEFFHSGEMSDFSSSMIIKYLNKTIDGKLKLTANSFDDIKFSSELTTPFEEVSHLHIKVNNNYNKDTEVLGGNAAIDTNIGGFGAGTIAYTKSGSLNNLKFNTVVLRNDVDVAELIIKNAFKDQELHFSFDSKIIKTPLVLLTFDHNGDISNMTTFATATMGKNIVRGETSLSQNSDKVDVNGKLTFISNGHGIEEISLNGHKEGHLNNFNVELSGRHGGKTTKITGNFKNKESINGDLTINTPIDGYKKVGMSFKHSGEMDIFNCEGKITVADDQEFSGKVDFYRHQYERIEAVVELNTPIADYEFTKYEYRHEGQSESFICSSSLEYGKSQRISYDLSSTISPKPQVTVTIKLPQQEYAASGSYENTWPKYSIDGKLDAGKGRSISLAGSLDASNDVIGVITLTTPVEDFNNVGLTFRHSLNHVSIDSEGSITFMDDKIISGKLQAAMNKKGGDAALEIKTPFEGYEFTRYEIKHVNNRMMKKAITKLIYGDNQRITFDTYLKLKPSSEFSLAISSPFTKENIEAFVSFSNKGPKGELMSRLVPGNGNKFTLEGLFDASDDISGFLQIRTPFVDFNKIGMNFIHSGNNQNFVTEGKMNYMDGKELFGKIDYSFLYHQMGASVELNTPFNGLENNKVNVKFEHNERHIVLGSVLEYNNGQVLSGNVKILSSPNYEVLVIVITPFDEINEVKARYAFDSTAPNYKVLSSFNYGYNMEYSAIGKLNLLSSKILDGSFELITPLNNLEHTKLEYQHRADAGEVEGSVSLSYDNGKKMSCDIKSVISPNFDGTVTIKTPFIGFEDIQASAAFDNSYKRYETSSSLSLDDAKVFSISSELDYSIEPMKLTTKIITPSKDFRNIELELTHEGSLSNFKSSGFLSSPITNHINAKASLRYDSMQDMSAAASLRSQLEGFDDLKAEWKTSDVTGEMKTNALLGWTSGQQIVYDGTFQKQKGWGEEKIHADVSLSMPFVSVRNVIVQVDHSAQTDSYAQKMNFELNGESLLDFDTEYKFNDRKSAELIVRQPWPMKYTASKYSNDGTMDAEVYIDWNRNEPDSNVRVGGSLTDKSDSYNNNMEHALDLNVEHAARKLGIVHKFSQKPSDISSNGYIYWNSGDDNKVSYDLQVNKNSRRNKKMVDSSLKLGIPTRTIGFTGSYSENSASTSSDATFSWDADRDDTKQISLKTNMKVGEIVKGDVTLSLPSLKKEIRIDGEVMVNNGRVILDTKTDISYSQDSRKTLTLTSKLEDLSSRNSFNYSLALGVKHPYTNVDIEMNSHLGKSNEKMTFGMATNYLTSKRQMKNLAILSEINMLKKQINVQTFNPLNKIELIGDIVSESPFKARILNKIDEVEAFRSDVTFDSAKKSVIFNAFYGQDMLTLAAKYPNKTAFKVDLTHHTPDFEHDEALLGVRLNTSHLLHTRLAWRPDMMQEFKEFVLPIALRKAESTFIVLSSMNEEIADELGSKYAAITSELSDEMLPLINALEEELDLVAEWMNEFSQDLEVHTQMDAFIQQNTYTYKQMISSMREDLSEMSRVHLGARYRHFVAEKVAWLIGESMKIIGSLELYKAETEMILDEYKNTLMQLKMKAVDTVLNATSIDYLADRVSKLQTVDFASHISSFGIPTQYTNIASTLPSRIHTKLNKVLDDLEMEYVKERLNEVYQQSVWTYNYWQMEENLQKYVEIILNILKDVIEEELREYSVDLRTLLRNPITVWDPEHGEVQADIPLPIAVKRLDQIPDIKPLLKTIEKFANNHLPDQGTLDNLVETVSAMLPVQNNTILGDLEEELIKYKPSKKYRKKKGRRYRVKKAGQ